MALSYRTEYRIGGRGRISRSYTGFQAFLAIFFDLIFGLVFDLVTSVVSLALRLVFLILQIGWVALRRSWSTLVVLMTAVLYTLTLPFVMLHYAVNRLRSRFDSGRDSNPTAARKPDWALGREV